MAKVLVIWEEIPEETKFFLLDLEGEELKKTLKCNGHLMNTVDQGKEIEFLCEFLTDKPVLQSSTELKGKPPIDVRALGIDFIVWTGFIL